VITIYRALTQDLHVRLNWKGQRKRNHIKHQNKSCED